MQAEPFELSLLGGAAAARYRRLRITGDNHLPWALLDAAELAPAEAAAARGGWTAAALQEYASAAAQAAMLRSLIRARVPLDLSGMASGFAHDELVHAEICARMAEGLGGGTTLPVDDSQFPPAANGPDPLLDAAKLVVWNCCVCESWSTAVLREMEQRTTHPVAQQAWGLIARDETLHGRFGWLFLDWLAPALGATERAVLAKTAAAAIATLRKGMVAMRATSEHSFVPLGVFPGFTRDELATFAEAALVREAVTPLCERGIEVR